MFEEVQNDMPTFQIIKGIFNNVMLLKLICQTILILEQFFLREKFYNIWKYTSSIGSIEFGKLCY